MRCPPALRHTAPSHSEEGSMLNFAWLRLLSLLFFPGWAARHPDAADACARHWRAVHVSVCVVCLTSAHPKASCCPYWRAAE